MCFIENTVRGIAVAGKQCSSSMRQIPTGRETGRKLNILNENI
jgi:hypothetical protein